MISWIASPVLVQLGPFELRWYALLFVVGMILAFRFGAKTFVLDGPGYAHAERLFMYVFVGSLLGARMGHVLFYEPEGFLAHPLKIFKIWEGGLASHGAVMGAVAAGILFNRRHKLGFLFMADRVSICIVLMGGFIRLGNLFNSEILGKKTDLPWAIVFPRVDRVPRHPAQLYEAFYYFFLFFVMKNIYFKTNLKNRRGFFFGIFLFGVFVFRFLVEFLKENQVASEAGLPLNLGQILSVPFIAMGLYLLVKSQRVDLDGNAP